jgi:hypothetical protein
MGRPSLAEVMLRVTGIQVTSTVPSCGPESTRTSIGGSGNPAPKRKEQVIFVLPALKGGWLSRLTIKRRVHSHTSHSYATTPTSPTLHLPSADTQTEPCFDYWGRGEGSIRSSLVLYTSAKGITKRCRLSWLTNSALVYEPECGGGEFRGLSQ